MRLSQSILSLGLGAGALVTITTSCESFEGAPADAGASDVGVAIESGPPSEDASGLDAGSADASGPAFCALLPPIAGGRGRFCDDFDRDPTKVDFAGWVIDETAGSGLSSYNHVAASKPWGFASLLNSKTSNGRALIRRNEPAGKKFRVRFDIMGDGPPAKNAPLYIARVVLDDSYVLSVRAFGEGDPIEVSEAKRTDAGVTNGANAHITKAPLLAAGRWFTVEIVIDEALAKWRVTFDGQGVEGSAFTALSSQPRLRLELGAEVVNATPLAQNTTLHYDNVLIEADR